MQALCGAAQRADAVRDGINLITGTHKTNESPSPACLERRIIRASDVRGRPLCETRCLGYRQVPAGQTQGPRLSFSAAGDHVNWLQAEEPLWGFGTKEGDYDYPSLTERRGSSRGRIYAPSGLLCRHSAHAVCPLQGWRGYGRKHAWHGHKRMDRAHTRGEPGNMTVWKPGLRGGLRRENSVDNFFPPWVPLLACTPGSEPTLRLGGGKVLYSYGVYFPPAYTYMEWCTILFRHPVATHLAAAAAADDATWRSEQGRGRAAVGALQALSLYRSAAHNDTWGTDSIGVAMPPLGAAYTCGTGAGERGFGRGSTDTRTTTPQSGTSPDRV